jgi:glycosyltransferase involved in cell wall biosynthesis
VLSSRVEPLMDRNPVVSIVICTRNRAKRLEGTIRSLAAIKSRHDWEALLVDNASADETMEVINAAANCDGRIRGLRVDRVGLGAARDAAWREARGSIISFTDDDCYLAPDYVDAVVEVFLSHPGTGCVGGRILLHDPEDARITIDEREAAVEITPYQFVMAGELHGANISCRRGVLEKIGGFDAELGAGTKFPCEDIDVVAAMLWAGAPVRFDPRPVVFHHHGRRAADVNRLLAVYDRGRGAYYAKYIIRSDTRRAYLRGWWKHANGFYYFSTLARLSREMTAAISYFSHRKRYGFALAAVPIFLAFYVMIAVLVLFRYGISRTSWFWRANREKSRLAAAPDGAQPEGKQARTF